MNNRGELYPEAGRLGVSAPEFVCRPLVSTFAGLMTCGIVLATALLFGPAIAHEYLPPDARLEEIAPRSQSFEPRFVENVCPFPNPFQFGRADVICGHVMVPEDRTNPASRLIRISVMKVPSTSSDPPGGTVLRLEGGPGGPGIHAECVAYLKRPESARLRAVAELICFDERGVGYSEAAMCRGIRQATLYGVPIEPEGIQLYHENVRVYLSAAFPTRWSDIYQAKTLPEGVARAKAWLEAQENFHG